LFQSNPTRIGRNCHVRCERPTAWERGSGVGRERPARVTVLILGQGVNDLLWGAAIDLQVNGAVGEEVIDPLSAGARHTPRAHVAAARDSMRSERARRHCQRSSLNDPTNRPALPAYFPRAS
jgi:hypothetical protein